VNARARPSPVLIAGAGPAGCALAALLARRGSPVWIVDASPGGVRRFEVVAPSGVRLLEAVGVAHLLEDRTLARPCPGIRRRLLSGRVEVDDFLRHPGGRGFLVDRARFDAVVHGFATDAGAHRIRARVVAVARKDGQILCRLSDGVEIAAKVAVDATGRPAALARRLGATRLVHDRLTASCEWRGAVEDPSAWLEVDWRAASWSYALTGPDGTHERWHVGHEPPKGSAPANASSVRLGCAAGDGWIAIGDAAAAFDPVASQGLANAFATAVAAAQILSSPQGLSDASGRRYADRVAATFDHSERVRRAIYAGRKGG
jgi:flavin-dependent dehydrogenase